MGMHGCQNGCEAEIAELNTVIDAVDDPREGYRIVRQHIADHQNRGEAIPEDLLRMERILFAECNAESQGR